MNKLRYIVVVIFSLFALNMSFAQEEQGEDVNAGEIVMEHTVIPMSGILQKSAVQISLSHCQ